MLPFLLHSQIFLLFPLTNLVASAPQATTYYSLPSTILEPTNTPFPTAHQRPTSVSKAPAPQSSKGPIASGRRNLTAVQSDAGDTHPCDGLNSGANPAPFNTALDALDAASKSPNPGFTYSLGYDGDPFDFYVLSLAGYSQRSLGPFMQEVQTGDDVLWAYGVSQTSVFLKVTPSTATVKKGGSVAFTITDGLSGKVQPSATIHDVQANAQGVVVVSYTATGYFPFKAKETGAVRSELVKVTVTS